MQAKKRCSSKRYQGWKIYVQRISVRQGVDKQFLTPMTLMCSFRCWLEAGPLRMLGASVEGRAFWDGTLRFDGRRCRDEEAWLRRSSSSVSSWMRRSAVSRFAVRTTLSTRTPRSSKTSPIMSFEERLDIPREKSTCLREVDWPRARAAAVRARACGCQ